MTAYLSSMYSQSTLQQGQAWLKHFGPPQVVNVDDAFEPPFCVNHHQRSDAAALHQIQGARGQLLPPDGRRRSGHQLRRRTFERATALALEEAPQVAVRNHAGKPPFAVHYSCV